MIIDCHCDALMKMWSRALSFENANDLAVNYERWMQSNVKVQSFAIFVPHEIPPDKKYKAALQMVELFYEKILQPHPHIRLILSKNDILKLKDHEKGAILTLEGVDCIGENLQRLELLIDLGVRMVGLSWNYRNAAVDGISEPENRGLTPFGKSVVQYLNERNIWIDVSHISLQGFNDVLLYGKFPIASHSNVYAITPHERNLRDYQIKTMIEKNALIGITYVSYFLTTENKAYLTDVIAHIQYLIDLGAENHIVIGSDFDGTQHMVEEIPTIDKTAKLIHRLNECFDESTVKKICSDNFLRHFPI